MNTTRHIYPSQISIVRTAVREALSNPTIMNCDPLAIFLALEGLAGEFQMKLVAGNTDTFAELSKQVENEKWIG